MAREKTENFIGKKSFFQGRFILKGSLYINGKYEGPTLEVDTLVVGVNGKVKSKIKANNVIVEGIIIGSISSTIRTMLYPTAKILGDITTPELIIQNGVIFEGRCHIINQNQKNPIKLINELYNQEL